MMVPADQPFVSSRKVADAFALAVGLERRFIRIDLIKIGAVRLVLVGDHIEADRAGFVLARPARVPAHAAMKASRCSGKISTWTRRTYIAASSPLSGDTTGSLLPR